MLTNLTNAFRITLVEDLSMEFDATVCDKESETTVLDLVFNDHILTDHIDQFAGLEIVTTRTLRRLR